MFVYLVLQGSDKSLSTTDFSSLCVTYISIPLPCNHDFNDLFYWFTTSLIQKLLKCISYCNICFVLQQNNPLIFDEISITHSKNLTPLLYLLINYMSARLAPQMLSRKDEHVLCLLNFLVMGLRNSLANCISSEIIPVPV